MKIYHCALSSSHKIFSSCKLQKRVIFQLVTNKLLCYVHLILIFTKTKKQKMMAKLIIIITFSVLFTIPNDSMAESVGVKEIEVQDFENIIDGKACRQIAIEYNEVSQTLHSYKRDFYITIIFIVMGIAIGITIFYYVKRRNANQPIRCPHF